MQQTQKNFEVQIPSPKEGRNAKHMYYFKEGTVKMRVTDGSKWPKLTKVNGHTGKINRRFTIYIFST